MNARMLAAAERAADVSLKILAALNLLFLAAFAATLLLGVSQARAQGAPVACTGEDLLAQLQRDDPAKLAEIRAEAAGVANGKGLLWRIEKDGAAPSYLFGTMHLSDPRVVALGPRALEAFEASSTVVIETTEVLDPAKMMAAMLANPELTMFTDATTLRSLIPADDLPMVEATLRTRGLPLSTINRMKPWMVAAIVALPSCEFERKTAGEPILDLLIAQQAQASGKELAGLETVTDQLGAMASLPMDLHVEGLVETLRLGDKIDDVLETMVTLYRSERIGMFWPFFRAVLPSGEAGAGYADFEEVMINARNRNMAASAEPFLQEGSAFIAVGALHLPGPEGLVALLRDAGYTVTPEPL